jgi:hypothetical protein
MIGKRLACQWGILSLFISSISSAVGAQPTTADTIYVNGKVFTADASDSLVEAFAVAGDRFIAVGSNVQVRKFAGADTRIVDLSVCPKSS